MSFTFGQVTTRISGSVVAFRDNTRADYIAQALIVDGKITQLIIEAITCLPNIEAGAVALEEFKNELAARLGVEVVFPEGTSVIKAGGDYTFDGKVVAAFSKASGARRYVVENKEGLLHVFGPKQLNRC